MAVRILIVLLVVLAAPVRADPALTRHLLARTGFTPSAEELGRFASLSYEQAVDRLLAEVRDEALPSPPHWVEDAARENVRLRRLSESERKAFRKARRERGVELKAWWYEEMLSTDSPLTERMVLFWHNHFTSSLKKVKSPLLMYRQNVLFRRYALGNFSDLIHAVARDPAMVVYLDNVSNRKASPNENFARELLELFTLGEGSYTESDIKETARAFTGWGVDRKSASFRFRAGRHDGGVKEILGERGEFDGDDVIDLLLAREETANTIVTKLWREFISDRPDPARVLEFARLWRANDYQIKPLLRAMLLSDEFVDPGNRGVLFKSPVGLLVGTLRMLGQPMRNGRRIAHAGRQLGQDLFDPPNVKGWPGGSSWIDANTLLLRNQIIERFIRHLDSRNPDPVANLSRAGLSIDPDVWLLAVARTVSSDGRDGRRGGPLVTALMDPAYQLK